MVKLTELAAKEIRNIIQQQQDLHKKNSEEEIEPLYLRVGVKGGGCSGFSYTLDLTETKTEMDEIVSEFGIDVVVDPKSALYLEGVEIDFKDELMGRGFVFRNPNATSTCGCGSSFST